MARNLIVAALVSVLVAQSCGAPARDFDQDKQSAQYGVVKLVSEVNILRMRSYLLIIEINHTIENLNIRLFDHMVAAGVPPATVTSLQTDFKVRTERINSNYNRVMDQANILMDHLYAMNNHIVYSPTVLADDLVLLSNYVATLQISYDSARENLQITQEFMKYKVEVNLKDLSGPDVDAANAIIAEEGTILNTEKMRSDEAKAVVDTTSITTKENVQNFIDLHVTPKKSS